MPSSLRSAFAGGLVVVAAVSTLWATACARDKLPPVSKDSGFAWLDGDDSIPHEIERSLVKKGIPSRGHPRDAIPPVNEPQWYGSLDEAEEDLRFTDDSRVLGVVVGDDVRAYPAAILDRHEVVNDTVGGRRLAVLW